MRRQPRNDVDIADTVFYECTSVGTKQSGARIIPCVDMLQVFNMNLPRKGMVETCWR